jgi:hypothetical protein
VSVAAVDRLTSIEEAARTIVGRIGIPKDRWEIAAQLEVLGLRDTDARDHFGCRDLFDAADRILTLFHQGKLPFHVPGEDPEPRTLPGARFVKHYLDGLMFALPMVLQGATMLLWGYGLWGARELDIRVGSAIALGLIASYVVTSGFAWAIVSRGLYYRYQKEGGLARWSALRMWSLSIRVAIALAIPAMLFNFVYVILPVDMALIALAYYVGLVFFWLNWSLMYLVGRTHWLLAALMASIIVVVVCARGLGWSVIAANLTGLAIADVLTFVIAAQGLKKWASNGGGKPVVNPPRLTVLVYATAKVFLYGFLYSLFIFTDRVVAWTATRGREDFPPYSFWLNARYELGVDLALIVVVVLAGLVEYSTNQFSTTLIPSQKRVKSASLEPFIDEFRRFYRRHSLFYWLGAVVAIGLAALSFRGLSNFAEPRLQASLASATTVRVFWIAAIAYAVFMFALQSVLMLMVLSRADRAARAIAMALVVNIVVGFAVSRAIHYSGAAVGLLAGSIALAILANRELRGVLSELDYYYYAAY